MGKFTVKIESDVPILSGISASYYKFRLDTYGELYAEAVWESKNGGDINELNAVIEFSDPITGIKPSADDLYNEHGVVCRLEGTRLIITSDYNPSGFVRSFTISVTGEEPEPPEPEYRKISIRNWKGVLEQGDYDPETGYNATRPIGEFLDFNGVIPKYPDGELIEIEGNYLIVDVNRLTNGKNVVDLYPDTGYVIDRVGLKIANSNAGGQWVDNPPSIGSFKPREIEILDDCFRVTFKPDVAMILVVIDGDGAGGGAEVAGGAYAHNYLLTKSLYDKVSGETFSIMRNNGGEFEILKFDQWIDNVRLYPFKVKDEDIGNEKNIIAGTFVLDTQAKTLRSDVIRLDYGEFNVVGSHGNSLDLRGVSCELVLPFVDGSITLDIQDIIDKTVEVVCYVVITDGVTTINIYADGELINTSSTTIGRSIPLMVVDKGANTVMTIHGAINDLRRAFIRVEKPKYNGRVLVERSDVLGNNVGYVEVMDSVRINATSTENEKLNSLLNRGVVIND